MNEVGEGGYGREYFKEDRKEIGQGNEKDGWLYGNKRFVGSDENGIESIVKERMRELLFEGKGWYEMGVMGDDYGRKYCDGNC